jgi:hypothetical protein
MPIIHSNINYNHTSRARLQGEKMSNIFGQFLGRVLLLFGLALALGSLPAPPADAANNQPSKGCCPPEGQGSCFADPVSLPFGNEYLAVTDFTTEGQNTLAVTRHYNSEAAPPPPPGSFGNWRWTYDRSLSISASEVDAARADGKVISFLPSASGWQGLSDLDLQLTQSGSTWTLTDWGTMSRPIRLMDCWRRLRPATATLEQCITMQVAN